MVKRQRTTKARTSPTSNPIAQLPLSTTEVASNALGALTRTAATTLSGARDVGAEIGSVAMSAIRGSVRAAGEIGADVGRLAATAAEGVIDAADRIAVATGKAVENIVTDTVEGFRGIMQGPAPRRPVPVRPGEHVRPVRAADNASRQSPQRKPLARRASRTMEKGRPSTRRRNSTG